MPTAELHDGCTIDVDVSGAGPAVLLPINPTPVEGPQADAMRAWGADPALGRTLINGLRGAFRVVAFDFEGHVLAEPKPDSLTPDNIASDALAVADAAEVDRFAWYGYSWLALSGLQVALRTDRVSALAMGGFPPLAGPYDDMLAVTQATYDMAADATPVSDTDWSAAAAAGDEQDWSSVEVTMSEPQARQFVTLYRALQDFDDRTAQARLTCPRLCFAGSDDEIAYDDRWGGVTVRIGAPLLEHRTELEHLGWDVRVLDGLDHFQAMQSDHVLPLLRNWFTAVLHAATGTRVR